MKSRCTNSKAVTVHGKGLDFTRVTKQDVHTESTPGCSLWCIFMVTTGRWHGKWHKGPLYREMHFASNRGPVYWNIRLFGLSLTNITIINTIYYYHLMLLLLNKKKLESFIILKEHACRWFTQVVVLHYCSSCSMPEARSKVGYKGLYQHLSS